MTWLKSINVHTGASLFTGSALITLIVHNRSYLLGSIDIIIVHITSIGVRYFHKGSGNQDNFKAAVDAVENLHHLYEDIVLPLPSEIVLSGGEWEKDGDVQFRNLTYISPIAKFLPPEDAVKLARAQVVLPSDASLQTWNGPWAIILPATEDEYFHVRRLLLSTPLARQRVASIIIQLPFYGDRRSSQQTSSALASLEDMATQSLAAITEAHVVAHWIHSFQPHAQIAFTGVSFGGAMASLASVHSRIDHACVHLVGTNSPHDAYVQGVLSKYVCCLEEADRLLVEMDIAKAAKTLLQADQLTWPTPRRVYHQLTARHDQYIPYHTAERLFEAMQSLPGHICPAQLTVLPGGHASAIVTKLPMLVDAIVSALQTLQT